MAGAVRQHWGTAVSLLSFLLVSSSPVFCGGNPRDFIVRVKVEGRFQDTETEVENAAGGDSNNASDAQVYIESLVAWSERRRDEAARTGTSIPRALRAWRRGKQERARRNAQDRRRAAGRIEGRSRAATRQERGRGKERRRARRGGSTEQSAAGRHSRSWRSFAGVLQRERVNGRGWPWVVRCQAASRAREHTEEVQMTSEQLAI